MKTPGARRRVPHSIAFLKSEWREAERAAKKVGQRPGPLVREVGLRGVRQILRGASVANGARQA